MAEQWQEDSDGTIATTGELPAEPYVGCRPFEERDAAVFFGREAEAWELLSLLISERIVLLHSPSGAGKTSLIRARLIGEMRRRRFHVYPIIRLSRPGAGVAADQNEFVHSALNSLLGDTGLGSTCRLGDLLNSGAADCTMSDCLEQIEGLLQTEASAESPRSRLLIFDQFEELLVHDAVEFDRINEFFQQLGRVLRDERVWALFAMREEYLASLEPFEHHIPTRLRHTFRLNLLEHLGAVAAIRGPVEAAGADISDETAALLARNLAQVQIRRPGSSHVEVAQGRYVEPVHLQIVCRRLWQEHVARWERDPSLSRELTIADEARQPTEAVGNFVDDALEEHYDRTLAEIAADPEIPPERRKPEREIRGWIAHYLVTVNGMRGQVQSGFEETRGMPNVVLEKLEQARIIRAEDQNNTQWFELAHDRLLRPVIESNEVWFEKNLTPLQHAAWAWDKGGRPRELLLHGAEFRRAEEQLADPDAEPLGPLEQVFFEESRREYERIAQRKRRKKVKLYQAIAGAALLVASALGCMALFLHRTNRDLDRTNRDLDRTIRDRDRTNLDLARAHHDAKMDLFAVEAQIAQGRDAESALRTSAAAYESYHGDRAGSAAHRALADILSAWGGRRLQHRDVAHRDETYWGTITNLLLTEKSVITTGTDGRMLVWNWRAVEYGSIRAAGAAADPAPRAFPDESHLLDVRPAIVHATLIGKRKWLLTIGDDRRLQLWRIADDAQGQILQRTGHTLNECDSQVGGAKDAIHCPSPHNGAITCAAAIKFQDSQWVATGDEEGVVCFWDVWAIEHGAREPLFQLKAHEGGVTAIASREHLPFLATGGGDGTVRLWDLRRLAWLTSRKSVQNLATAAANAFSGDEARPSPAAQAVQFRPATNTLDWDRRSDEFLGAERASWLLKAHNGAVTDLEFSRKPGSVPKAAGNAEDAPWPWWLVTIGDDGFAILWKGGRDAHDDRSALTDEDSTAWNARILELYASETAAGDDAARDVVPDKSRRKPENPFARYSRRIEGHKQRLVDVAISERNCSQGNCYLVLGGIDGQTSVWKFDILTGSFATSIDAQQHFTVAHKAHDRRGEALSAHGSVTDIAIWMPAAERAGEASWIATSSNDNTVRLLALPPSGDGKTATTPTAGVQSFTIRLPERVEAVAFLRSDERPLFYTHSGTSDVRIWNALHLQADDADGGATVYNGDARVSESASQRRERLEALPESELEALANRALDYRLVGAKEPHARPPRPAGTAQDLR